MYVGVDVGGTFTDIAINLGDGSELILYKLSSTPDSPEKAIVDGIETVLQNKNLNSIDDFKNLEDRVKEQNKNF